QLSEELSTLLGHLALADPRALPPAERQLSLTPDGGVVDVHHADLGALDELHREVRVARIDARREPEVDVVRGMQRLLEVPDLDDGDDGPEDLLLVQPHA